MRWVLWEMAKSTVEGDKLQDEPVASCSGRSKKWSKDRRMGKCQRDTDAKKALYHKKKLKKFEQQNR